MWNLGSGFAQGVYENHRGLDEKREYEELSQQRELARQRTQQIMDKDKIQMETMKYQLDALRMENLKMAAGNEKLKLSGRFSDLVDAVTKNRGNFRKDTQEEIDGNNLPENFDKTKYTYDPATNKYRGVKTEYTMPKDVEQAVNQFKRDVVIDPDGSRWINGIMGNAPDNPVIDVTYNPAKEEMVFMTKDGKERHMQLDMVAYGLGFDKQMKLADINRMNEDMARSKALYELENKKAEAYKNTAAGNKYNEEARYAGMDAQSRALNAHANELSAQAQMYKATNPEARMTTFDKKQAEEQKLADTDKQILEMPDKEAYDFIGKDHKMFNRHIAKTATQLQSVQDIQKAQAIGNRLRKFEVLMGQLKNYTGDTVIDNNIAALITRYVPDVATEDIKKATNLATFIQSYADQLSTDMIQIKSGAAFSETELGIQRNSLQASVSDFKSIETTLEGVKAFTKNWDTLVAGKIGTMDPYKQKYIYGSMERYEGNINKVEEKQTRIFMEDQINKIKDKSPEEQKQWFSTLSPEMKAMAAKIVAERKDN
nr:MAG TPA: hypothetical protein [Caudoviricetes sp.]